MPANLSGTRPEDAMLILIMQHRILILESMQANTCLRNAAYVPWTERFDMRILQDFKIMVKES